MFNNLDDQIRQTNGQTVSSMRQLLGVVGVTTVLFGSLYLGILFLE